MSSPTAAAISSIIAHILSFNMRAITVLLNFFPTFSLKIFWQKREVAFAYVKLLLLTASE
ncbi:MAG: hypothetical protein QXR01_02620 [Candidatus Bathyarchaeia archaeon]